MVLSPSCVINTGKSLEHGWGWSEEGAKAEGALGVERERSESKPWKGKRCPSHGLHYLQETSPRLVSVLIHSLELGGAEEDKAASQHGWGCLGTTAFPAEQGKAGLLLWAQPTRIWLIGRGFVPTTGGNSCSSPSKSATISHTNHFLSCLSFLKTWFCLFRSSHIKMQ